MPLHTFGVPSGGLLSGSRSECPVRGDIDEVISEVERRLGSGLRWIVSGSSALMLRGVPVQPNDVDIWCTQEALQFFANQVGQPFHVVEDEWIRHNSFDIHLGGWVVEVTGSVVIRRTGCVLEPDEEMFRRARSPSRVEPLEDVLAELLAMDRPPPKRDTARAFDIVGQPDRELDLPYFRKRCVDWQVDRQLYDRAVETYTHAHKG